MNTIRQSELPHMMKVKTAASMPSSLKSSFSSFPIPTIVLHSV